MRAPRSIGSGIRRTPRRSRSCYAPSSSAGLDGRRSGALYNRLVMEPRGYGHISAERLDATFAALADPTRRAILARLAFGQALVTQLTQAIARNQAPCAQHLTGEWRPGREP